MSDIKEVIHQNEIIPQNEIIHQNEITLENTENFKCLCIKPNNIEKFDWKHPEYLKMLLNQSFYETVDVSPDNLIEKIAECLHVNDYKGEQVNNYVIGENEENICEILFLDMPKEHQTPENENQMASLINTNGNKVYGYAFLLKTHLPIDSRKMYFKDIGLNELYNFMHCRANTSVVLYEDEYWREERIIGDTQVFADHYFGEDKYKYKKIELPFLLHNINIWYLPDEYGEKDVCGSLLKQIKIDKCILFTMSTTEYRGNLSLDEVKKIIELSVKLKDYTASDKLIEDEVDSYNRKVIKNKYRILDLVHKETFKKV